MTDAASDLLEKGSRSRGDVFDLCYERRELKKNRYEAEGPKEYRGANKRIQKAVKKAKEDCIDTQCEETETCRTRTTAREQINCSPDRWQHGRMVQKNSRNQARVSCHPSSLHFSLEQIMSKALEEHDGKVSIGSRKNY